MKQKYLLPLLPSNNRLIPPWMGLMPLSHHRICSHETRNPNRISCSCLLVHCHTIGWEGNTDLELSFHDTHVIGALSCHVIAKDIAQPRLSSSDWFCCWYWRKRHLLWRESDYEGAWRDNFLLDLFANTLLHSLIKFYDFDSSKQSRTRSTHDTWYHPADSLALD